MIRCIYLAEVVGCLAILVPIAAAPVPKGQEKVVVPRWEHKAVSFGSDEKEATKKLNDLARNGWEYVGPLGNGLVAFKKAVRSAQDLELDKIQGTWILVSREEGGQVTPAADDTTTFTVTGDRWVWKDNGVAAQSGIWKLVGIDEPAKSYDNLVTEGNNMGATAQGIYLLEGDSFKYCEGATRPTGFTTKDGDGRYCCVWKRSKK